MPDKHNLTPADRSRGGHARAAKIRAQKEAARRAVEEQLRAYAERAVARVGTTLDSTNERVGLAAAKEVLDLVLGRATQPLEHSGPDGDPIELELAGAREKFAARIEALVERRKAQGDSDG